MKPTFILFLLFLANCAGPNELSSHLTKSEANRVVSLAREKVLASGLVKDAKEIEIIGGGEPSLAYYFLARPYADYSVSWRVDSNESVGVYGRGNILVLENAQVTRGDIALFKAGR